MTRLRRGLFGFLIAVIIPACGGSNTKVAATLPNAPTTLVATVQTSARIDLTWVDTANNEFEFRIERADAVGGPYVQIATVAMNLQGYTDLGLQANKAYYYQVAAWNGKGLSAFAGPATATTNGLEWIGESMTGGPALGRAHHSAIYDSSLAGQRMIVFGGIDDGFTFLNDVWSFSLASTIPASPWTSLSPTGAIPPPLFGHSAIYDSLNHRMIVFGGQAELTNPTPPPPLILAYQNAVHILDLVTLTWSLAAVTGTPPSPRAFHSAIYDSANQQMVVYGGNDASAAFFGDLHTLSLPASPPFAWNAPPMGARPVPRTKHAAVYDPLRSRMVMFAGLDNDPVSDGSVLGNQTWTSTLGSGFSWTLLSFPGTPGFRQGHSAVYDAANQRIVVFGGDTTTGPVVTNEMWGLSLDATPNWSIMTPTTGLPPAGRYGHSAIYDSAFKRMIVYGGYDDFATAYAEVWRIDY